MDDQAEECQLLLAAEDVISSLNQRETVYSSLYTGELLSGWHPEYGSYMVEGVTDPPYDLTLDVVPLIQPSITLRRFKLQSVLDHFWHHTDKPVFASRFKDATTTTTTIKGGGVAPTLYRGCVASISNLPIFGCGGHHHFTHPPSSPSPDDRRRSGGSRSRFLSDTIINAHPRFNTLTQNIRMRRGQKVAILVPVYNDLYTAENHMWKDALPIEHFLIDPQGSTKSSSPTITSGSSSSSRAAAAAAAAPDHHYRHPSFCTTSSAVADRRIINRQALEERATFTPNPVAGHIYMDAMGFGMGMSCVQSTYLCPTLDTARYLYDQLAVLAPLWLAMTAATPFHRGLLADTDARWEVIGGSVDCRTQHEEATIPKSRYSSVSSYISENIRGKEPYYNDTAVSVDQRSYHQLINEGVDELMARHVASLFIRDALVIYADKVEQLKDETSSEHFENIQSTNWNSVRFKPPPASSLPNHPSEIGWRVEFRTAEVQLSDFENAAFLALITTLVQIILAGRLELYIPMSLNDRNMQTAISRDGVRKKFYFRNHVAPGTKDTSHGEKSLLEIFLGRKSFCSGDASDGPSMSRYSTTSGYTTAATSAAGKAHRNKSGSCTLHPPSTMGAICPSYLGTLEEVGLIGICRHFVFDQIRARRCSCDTMDVIFGYFNFIEQRLSGQVPTNAGFLRDFVTSHPDYRYDSVITPSINYDLCELAVGIGQGKYGVDQLFGKVGCGVTHHFKQGGSGVLPPRIKHTLDNMKTKSSQVKTTPNDLSSSSPPVCGSQREGCVEGSKQSAAETEVCLHNTTRRKWSSLTRE